jgi:autotransporter-associated beta strand protein
MPCPCCCLLCTGGTCCGDEYPRHIGVCCDGEWRSEAGVCCDGEWYPAGTAGVCCDDTWQTADGVCCDGYWHTDAGFCCAGVWFVTGSECPVGFTYFEVGSGESPCCICIPDEVVADGQGPDDVPYCCDETGGYPEVGGECRQMCCEDYVCTMAFPSECVGVSVPGGCIAQGCPVNCCEEDTDGVASCGELPSVGCVSPKQQAVGNDCATGCLGECCIDDVSRGPTTQSDCDDLGGCWGGLGSTECAALCRSPLADTCCETKQSSAAGLTFTQPRRLRCPEITETIRVTVTGTTDSAILIHGTPFGLTGTPKKRCAINHTFVICWDSFNIEPVPCGTDFHNLDVEVCWGEEATQSETLNFSGCNNITVWLGACDRDGCVTALSYTGAGHTSNAGVVLYGDGAIDASGTGALVLTSNITHGNSCERTLTLAGSNTNDNQISGVIQNGSGTAVSKTGVGVWRLSGNSTYSGQLRVLDGTLVVAAIVTSSGASPFGTAILDNLLPIIGSSAAGATGTASLLIAGGNSIERGFSVAASNGGQIVVLGATDTGSALIGFAGTEIRLNRSAITLQAADTAEAVFAGNWRDGSGTPNPTVAYTIGAPGNAGVVAFESVLSSNASGVNIVNGTARLTVGNDDRINPATPVTIGSSIGPTTLNIFGQSQTLANVAFTVASGSINNGTLRLTGTVATTGTGHAISSAVALDAAVTFSGSGELTISGVVSGSNGITKNGSGTLGLSASNTFSGGTEINDGTAKAEHISAFGTGAIVVNAGGTLDKNGFAIANAITNNGGTVLN